MNLLMIACLLICGGALGCREVSEGIPTGDRGRNRKKYRNKKYRNKKYR
jgi:hypothetical protein